MSPAPSPPPPPFRERDELAPLAALLEQLVEQIARRVVRELAELEGTRPAEACSPWMGIEAAASYLDWPKQRIYKLSASGQIPHYKHEARLLLPSCVRATRRLTAMEDWISASCLSDAATT